MLIFILMIFSYVIYDTSYWNLIFVSELLVIYSMAPHNILETLKIRSTFFCSEILMKKINNLHLSSVLKLWNLSFFKLENNLKQQQNNLEDFATFGTINLVKLLTNKILMQFVPHHLLSMRRTFSSLVCTFTRIKEDLLCSQQNKN